MKINFLANWYPNIQHNIPKGILALEIKKKDIKKVGEAINKLNEYQTTKNELKDLELSLDIYFKKRSLDQNALMHSLYAVIANEMNGDYIGENAIQPIKLYEDDLHQFGMRMELKVPNENVNIVKSMYRIIESEKKIDEKTTYLKVILTSSHFNTKQMKQWIDMLFNRLSDMGLNFDNSAQIKYYWEKWKEHKEKDQKINNDSDNIQEYKKNHSDCEACGHYIGGDIGLGQLAHIKSIGAGGKNKAYNYLHLCGNCHLKIQHQKGWTEFCQLFPHLKNKIENALLNDTLSYAEKNIQ